MARTWTRRQASPPTSITEIARRYHAAAVALAQTLGLSVPEVFAQHRESVTAIFIETSRAELRLPATMKLPPLAGEHVADAPVVVATGEAVPANSGEFRPATGQNSSNGDERPTTIPLAGGLPCGGQAIATLKPGALSMLRSKVATLIHAEGDRWVPLLAALEAERQRRMAPSHIRLVEPALEVTAAPLPEASPLSEAPTAPLYATPEQVRSLKRLAAQVGAEAAEDLADVLDHSPKGLLMGVYTRIDARLHGRLTGQTPGQ